MGILYLIKLLHNDNSFFMNEDYLHKNGQIINGIWQPIDEPGINISKIKGI